MPFTLLSGLPIRDHILANYRPTKVTVPDVRVTVVFDDPTGQLEKAFKTDPLLDNQVRDKVKLLVTGDLARLMAATVANTELNVASAQNSGKTDLVSKYAQQLGAQLDEVKKQIYPKLEQVGTASLAQLAAKRKEYRSYKIKAGVSVTLGAAGVLASVASIGLSGGGSSLIALIGIARGVSEIVQQCKSLYDEAEQTSLRVHGAILGAMKTRSASNNKDVNALLEVGRAAVKALTTIDLVATPAKADELNQTFRMKLTGLDVGSHDTAEQLNKLLVANEGLMAEVRKGSNPAIAQKLEKSEAKVHQLLVKITGDDTAANPGLIKRIKAGELQYEFYRAVITELKKSVASWAGPAATAAKLLINTGIGLATGAAGGAMTPQGAASGLPFGSTAENLTEGAKGVGKIFVDSASMLLELIGDYQEIAGLFGEDTLEQVQKAYPDLKPIKKSFANVTPSPAARTGAPLMGGHRAPPPLPPKRGGH